MSYCSYQSNLARDVQDSIMSIQPKDSGAGGSDTRETVVFRQAGDMLDKLPPDYVPHEVSKPHSLTLSSGGGLH